MHHGLMALCLIIMFCNIKLFLFKKSYTENNVLIEPTKNQPEWHFGEAKLISGYDN